MSVPDRLDLARTHVSRVQAAHVARRRKAAIAQAAVPAILQGLLASMMTTVRLCDRCMAEHFQPQPERRGRDCLIVKCECWCTTRRDQ